MNYQQLPSELTELTMIWKLKIILWSWRMTVQKCPWQMCQLQHSLKELLLSNALGHSCHWISQIHRDLLGY
jgi:hypothetical protein